VKSVVLVKPRAPDDWCQVFIPAGHLLASRCSIPGSLLRTYLVSLSLVTVSRRVTVLFEGLPPFLRGSFGKITPTKI